MRILENKQHGFTLRQGRNLTGECVERQFLLPLRVAAECWAAFVQGDRQQLSKQRQFLG